jgi:hypothetical protein
MGLLQKKKTPEKGKGGGDLDLTDLRPPDVSAALAKAEAAEKEAVRLEKEKAKKKQRSCCGCCW